MGSYPWFNAHATLYHTHVYHSEPIDECPDHSDRRQARSGVPFSPDPPVCFSSFLFIWFVWLRRLTWFVD
jgi:hypothetical protein